VMQLQHKLNVSPKSVEDALRAFAAGAAESDEQKQLRIAYQLLCDQKRMQTARSVTQDLAASLKNSDALFASSPPSWSMSLSMQSGSAIGPLSSMPSTPISIAAAGSGTAGQQESFDLSESLSVFSSSYPR